MRQNKNPFEYDAAPNLDPELLILWFIEDHNHARFLQSTRNVLINGQRGSGKSMALIFNSAPYQLRSCENSNKSFPQDNLGIYVPCNTPLTHKQEYRLLPEVEQAILSEQFFVYGIGTAIAKDLEIIVDKFSKNDLQYLRDELSLLTSTQIDDNTSPFLFLRNYFRARLKEVQECLGKGIKVNFEFTTSSFYNSILPILSALRETELLQSVHISLLIDDAQDLNFFQQAVLNSWLGYRDHSVFSFKIAIAGIRHYNFKTAFGGSILEGHDYITVDFDQPFQNDESNFGKFARDVVENRLKTVEIYKTADEFFPESPEVTVQISRYMDLAVEQAKAKGITDSKAIGDYRYKYGRALYFKERSSGKSNRPQYAGFNTIAHVSTGVIRNLLNPCYWMYEELLSRLNDTNSPLEYIPPDLQSTVILSRSDDYWEMLRTNLSHRIAGCSESDAKKLVNLFTKLCEHFLERLKKHASEPRVITFTITAYSESLRNELEPLLILAEKAQLIYVRSGPKKKGGGRENFYVLNRLLLPAYSLDVTGQHGRASLQAKYLVAATLGKSIPLTAADETESPHQEGLFDV